jgi:hypothetical protein
MGEEQDQRSRRGPGVKDVKQKPGSGTVWSDAPTPDRVPKLVEDFRPQRPSFLQGQVAVNSRGSSLRGPELAMFLGRVNAGGWIVVIGSG